MITVKNLSFSFGHRPLFSGLDFTIQRGELISILGPNGCGKSTLLRLLRGSLPPVTGEICWHGMSCHQISPREMSRRVAVVPQSTRIDFPYRVQDMVAMGRYPHRRSLLSFSNAADREAIRHALVVTDILALADRPVTELSGGELQRVLFARALAQQAEVLFLDEATSHLDIDHRLELSELLIRLNREQGVTIVQISHDLDLAAAVSGRILLLSEHGESIGFDTPARIITPENLQRAFRVEVRIATNPLTGAPQVLPLLNTAAVQLDGLKVHLFCGGGSGKSLLRKLHLAKATVSAGPLNQGDADEEVATALNSEVIYEVPFQPFSGQSISATRQSLAQAEVIIIATIWWGNGNLPCLDLAAEALQQGTPVYLLNPTRKQDFTAGKAWGKLQALQQAGAMVVANEEQLMSRLAGWMKTSSQS